MRFLVFMIPAEYQPKNGKPVDPGFAPDTKEMMAKMGRFNDELKKSGALRAVDGLLPLTKGARLYFLEGDATEKDGTSIDAKEVIGGYWLVEAKSKQQVVEWFKRIPAKSGDVIEIRQIAEITDFPPDIQAALRNK